MGMGKRIQKIFAVEVKTGVISWVLEFMESFRPTADLFFDLTRCLTLLNISFLICEMGLKVNNNPKLALRINDLVEVTFCCPSVSMC